MTVIWLASYVALWGLVVVVCLFLVGLLRQFGALQSQLDHPPVFEPGANMPALENDGPTIGSHLPDLVAETINGFGEVALATRKPPGRTLLMFMAPLCESCQHMVSPLNMLAGDPAQGVLPIVFMRADEQTCRSFLSVFPLRLPLVCDDDRSIHRGLEVHRAPLGLLYSENGQLVRKGAVQTDEDLQSLLGNVGAPIAAQANIFPPVRVLA